MSDPTEIAVRLRARAEKITDDLPDVVVGFDAACAAADLYEQAARTIYAQINEIVDLRWLVGHLHQRVQHGGPTNWLDFAPPRLAAIARVCIADFDIGKFTFAGIPPAREATP